MSAVEVGAHLIGQRYACDECGSEMRQPKGLSVMLASHPPQYPHECDNGHTANLGSSYPTYGVRLDALPPSAAATSGEAVAE